LLGVRFQNILTFYDWQSLELVRRIEILAKNVIWNDSGTLVSIIADESYYVLQYKSDIVSTCLQTQSGIDEDGVIEAFDVLSEIQEVVRTGKWVGDCFIYTTSNNRLNY
ncbi:hypothetical protein, partial [Salmonella sp. s51228]|uniref:hypothetical protein n=1 Tax=Salmonella sp. s51228 TaxID=3159652 RepID=UPI00397F21A9